MTLQEWAERGRGRNVSREASEQEEVEKRKMGSMQK